LVDDASSDDTSEVAAELRAQYPGIVDYVRNDVNRKQAYAKNRGKSMADTEYVYFGDDDSLLMPGSMAALLETMKQYRADIVGAIALYCTNEVTPEQKYREYLDQGTVEDPRQFADLKRLRFQFTRRPSAPISVPITQAPFLARREWYKRIHFDLLYGGNCFREETDFLLQATSAGARILLDGRAVQINLPPTVATGGARSASRPRYEWQALVNTAKFLRKHRGFYREQLGVLPYTPMLWYIWDRIAAAGRRVSR
jgi:glycosyltransferase involved in cell wall biosynthesis